MPVSFNLIKTFFCAFKKSINADVLSGSISSATIHKDQRGNIAIIFSLALTGLFAAGGVAIDMVRVNSAQSSLYAAMDAAVFGGYQRVDGIWQQDQS